MSPSLYEFLSWVAWRFEISGQSRRAKKLKHYADAAYFHMGKR